MAGFWIAMAGAVVVFVLVFFSGIYVPERRVRHLVRRAWAQWVSEVHWSLALARLKDQWEGENSPSSLDTTPALRFRRPHRAAKRRRWRRRRQRNRRRLYWIYSHPASRRGFKAIQLSSAELEALREAKII